MKYSNLLSGIIFFALSLFICLEALRFGFGKWSEPGAGFLPFWAGLLFAGFSLYVVIEAIAKGFSSGESGRFEKTRWGKWVLILVSLLAYALLLESLGFILCTFALMIVLVACVEPQRWIVVLLVGVITTAASYLIFQWFLKAQLPEGILGI